jgi:hypothetical protein
MGTPAKTAHLSDSQSIDFTKSRLYAWTDLIGKSISAVALVILGIAGFLLQRSTERNHEVAEARGQQERQYLPMLRSLSLLEVELEDVAQEVERSGDARDAGRIGTNLRFVSNSVFVPDGDPTVMIRPPDKVPGPDVATIQMPLRATALMYSEALRIRENFHDAPDDMDWRLDIANATLVNARGGREHLIPDSLPAWQAWLGDRTIANGRFRLIPNVVSLQDLIFATDGVIQNGLRQHPGLGDQYVQLREELEKNRPSPDRTSTDSAGGKRDARSFRR